MDEIGGVEVGRWKWRGKGVGGSGWDRWSRVMMVDVIRI